MYTCIYKYIYTHIHTDIHIYLYTYTHTHILSDLRENPPRSHYLRGEASWLEYPGSPISPSRSIDSAVVKKRERERASLFRDYNARR